MTYSAGGIWYSNDGKNWTNCSKEPVTDIAYNGVLYIITYNGVDTWVVGSHWRTGNNLAYSNDGKNWTAVTNIFVDGLVNSIVYNGVDTWVAIGTEIAYSNDGKIWTSVIKNSYFFGNALVYDGDKWVALGENGYQSTDRKIWTEVKIDAIVIDVAYNGVDTLVAVRWSNQNTSSISYSKDGVTWKNGTNIFPTSIGFSVAYNGIDTWVAVGGGLGTSEPTICYSNDSVTWKNGTDIFSGGTGISVSYTWVAIGYAVDLDVKYTFTAAYSKDGINWTIGSCIIDSHLD